MPSLALAHSFLLDFGMLQKRVRRDVVDVILRFEKIPAVDLRKRNGTHLEKINGQRDPRTRTIRIDGFWRGIVMAPDDGGQTYVLHKVLPHDDAIEWAKKHAFGVNSATRRMEVRDVEAIEEHTSANAAATPHTVPKLFAALSDGELGTLGIDPLTLAFARTLTRKNQVETAAEFLPEDQHEVLMFLAEGFSVEEVWRDIVAHRAQPQAAASELEAAVRSTPNRIVLVEGSGDLAEALDKPFEAWRVFLHPAQRKVAYRPSYPGPAQVAGGPGTGKTVVALHRVAFLLGHLRPGERILLTSYTNALVDSLTMSLALLVEDPALRERVDIMTVDSFARKVLAEHGTVPRPLRGDREPGYWEEIIDARFLPWTAPQLAQEYRHVVLARDVRDEDGYLAADRAGRGSRLAPSMRPLMWAAMNDFEKKLAAKGEGTYLGWCRDAADLLAENGPRYRHIVVDEAQDLHPAQWRLLRAAAPAKYDDLFIAADPHQRIYDSRVSLKSLGINVVGRSTKMRRNYRSTRQILGWAAALVPGAVAALADGADDSLAGYRSVLEGPEPVVFAAASVKEEEDRLVEVVRVWITQDASRESIGVAVRFNRTADKLIDRLKKAGIPATDLRTSTANAVRVGTMHAFKGLEFRSVAVFGASREALPFPKAMTDADIDRVQHEIDLAAERNLLFVACTRARDQLHVSWTGDASPFLVEAGVA
ncbi:UvrD-helicase domain-containing protein [Phytomonospora sp. NPDC050363]|uniref:UvrD-helicase domain-containing protein n=1 Tax=Phytomonospora sp. NPDC050363 TaxID=3155642 RepID=UPI0033EC3D6A